MTHTVFLPDQHHQHMLGEAELAQRWKVSKRTIQRWRQEGRLPEEFRIGRKVLFSAEVILAFENASQCKAEGR